MSKKEFAATRIAKMIGISDAENGRQMDDSIFSTEIARAFYKSSYETRLGEIEISRMGICWV
jgi:hypothetical protein